MQNLFELMPNLEEVHFYCIFAERVHSNFLNPQKRIYPSWKKVKIFIDFGTVRHNFLLELLAYVTSIESFESDGNPPRSFQLLLCRQTNLRELILINDEVNLLQLVKTETPFKLKTFKYSALDKNNVMDTLKKFLENQQDLEELEIKIASLTWKRPLREIMNLPCLKKLKLDFFGSILPAENPFKKYNRTIEHLEIRLECIQSLDNIMDSLANLKSLKLHLMAGFNGQLSEISFEYLTNLRDVSVVFDYGGFVDFPNIRMTQLKSVTLMHHENCYLHSWGKLLKHNPNIDSITFESGDVREIVIEFIAKNFKKLSTFICQNWVHPLNKNAIEILCENCENLYCIELRLRGSEADYAETFKKFEDKLKKITYKWSFIK